MKNEKRKTIIRNLKLSLLMLWFCVFSFSLLAYLSASACWAVSSKITRHSSSSDLLKGQIKDVVIDSQGNLQLGWGSELLVEEFENVWSINSVVVSGGTVFIGTSPNGGIYRYSLDTLTRIYRAEDSSSEPDQPEKEDTDQEEQDVNEPEEEAQLKSGLNEHIFAMALDAAGRLLAGISGDVCRLIRFERGQIKTVFQPDDEDGTKYIFAIVLDDDGDIYLGTGPEGKVYRTDAFGKNPELVYDSRDKNILSLAIGKDGFVYAGSDSRGLVYKINTRTKTATVLYDSDQPEITALLFAGDGQLCVAATSAEITQAETKFASQLPFPGRPETKTEQQKDASEGEGGLKLQIANTKKSDDGKPPERVTPIRKPAKPAKASYIYKITEDGFVDEIFTESAVFLSLARQQDKLLVGTGNNARLFTVESELEQQAIIYEDQQASQITSIAVVGEDVYIGTANPAKLIKLGKLFASEGTYTSDLIDAGQPAKWGKLQIEADIPEGCKVMVASRSGNVKDVNDPTFSDWTELLEVTEPIQLQCPSGRFCQYKLLLQSLDGQESPVVREIAVASSVPNLKPRIESVNVSRVQSAGKEGVFKISYKAKDDNGDKLIYKIDFRKIGRESWVKLKDEIEADNFEWDTKTVEDGRYEIRVTASDERSNSTATKLTGSRVSEPVVADNTAPIIEKYAVEKEEKTVTLKLQVFDELSAIGRLDYTVNSNEDWLGAVPEDLVYDTIREDFTAVIEDLEAGEHVIAVRVRDDIGNTTYKTFEVNID
ncbi:MAG: hypothetical protein ACYS8Y_03780 [Planctomycetota bacterium]|jgi:hypothetical protein